MDKRNILVIPFKKDEVSKKKWFGRNDKPYHSITINNQEVSKLTMFLFKGIKQDSAYELHWLHLIINNKHYRVISYQHGSKCFVCVRYKR